MRKIHIFKVEARLRSNRVKKLRREKISIKLKEELGVSVKKGKEKKKGDKKEENLTYKSLWM